MKPVTTVGIVGAGTMGSALSQKFALVGMNVILTDHEQSHLNRGLQAIRQSLKEGVRRNLFSSGEVDMALERISPTTDLEALTGCELIIEAVYEDREVKGDLLGRLATLTGPETMIATNTSSFTVRDLATNVEHPERFLGLHFFYHAAKNRLVEIIPGPATDRKVFEEALWTMRVSGKDPIVCNDSPGFVVNRFFVPWMNEATRLLAEQVASPGEIDAVARGLFKCGMGPFALMNATGIAIAFHASTALGEAFGSFYRPSNSLQDQALKDEDWIIGAPGHISDDTRSGIASRLIGAVLLPAGQLLDEQVCTADEIHTGARIGLRWGVTPVDLVQTRGIELAVGDTATIAKLHKMTSPTALSAEKVWRLNVVRTHTSGDTGVITINRPYALNALNPATVDELAGAFTAMERDDSLQRIILTGSGKAFVAGADIPFFLSHMSGGNLAPISTFSRTGQTLFTQIDESNKTVIAVVNGMALGGGLELALTADIIVAVPSSTFAFPETGIGIYPGLGGTQRTADRIGQPLTKYLIYTGQTLTAEEALEIGLIDLVVPMAGIREILAGAAIPERRRIAPSDKWGAIAAIFESCCVDELLAPQDELEAELLSKEAAQLLRRIRQKAPIALRLAEELIDRQEGPLSELEYIMQVFSTKDALAGLQSVGGSPPVFAGE
ncbi:MAG: 3-hydroxyacyl-CoA dehydrogenase/enoyl-CoA hydratase family protein [Candidatus Neomarinimicrobiota bacterium]